MENTLDKAKPFLIDWWYVDKRDVPEQLYSYLTLRTVDEVGNPVENIVWSETSDTLGRRIVSFPRYCEYGNLIFKNPESYLDCRTDGVDISFNMKVGPRDDYQKTAIDTLVASEHGVCQAKTAFGKTYVAINVISKIKKKTLILVHKTPLAEQWKRDILAYTDLKDDDVVILKGKKINLDKPIVISTVQNFVAKNNNQCWELRNKMISANFGITFYDEVHATAAPSAFALSSRWFASKRVFGLSATPIRGDENDKMVTWSVGDIIYKDNRPMMPIYVSFIDTPVNLPISRLKYMQYGGNDFMHRYLEWYCKTPEYIDTAVTLIVDLIKLNKKILAVCKYKDILDLLFEEVKKKLIENNLPVSKIIMIHGTSEAKLLDAHEDEQSCIFSTDKFFSDGLSVAWLDTLIYLTPPSSKSLVNIPQIIGRIVRSYVGKHYVTVYDIFNGNYDIERHRKNKRHGKYIEFGYNILANSSMGKTFVNDTEENVFRLFHQMCDDVKDKIEI